MLRTAAYLLSGNAFGWLFLFARNLLIARLISVEDYGIAATFALSMAVVEMASGLGIQQLIVQDKNGDDPEFQAGLQAVHLIRSLLSAAMLFLLAPVIARFLGIPEVAWAYQVLAIIPGIRGLEHFDMHRLNRRNIYTPIILHTAIPAVVSLVAVWPLVQFFGDYRVMLYAMLLQWVLGVVVSHLVARRRYGLSFDRAIIRKCLNFGWPVMVNNVLMFFVLQGDKAIVARELGMETFAVFAMGVTLMMVPVFVASKSEQMFFLPRLSSAQSDPDRFNRLALTAMQVSLTTGLLLVLGVLLLGEPVVRFLLGEKYAALIPLLIWLAVQQAVRGFKGGSTSPALARAFTTNAMIANIVRLLVLPVVWYGAINGMSLVWIIIVSILGELVSYFTSLWLVRTRVGVPVGEMFWPVGLVVIWLALAALSPEIAVATETSEWLWKLGIAGAVIPVVFMMRRLRAYLFAPFLSSGAP